MDAVSAACGTSGKEKMIDLPYEVWAGGRRTRTHPSRRQAFDKSTRTSVRCHFSLDLFNLSRNSVGNEGRRERGRYRVP